jgi:hypothetical protein
MFLSWFEKRCFLRVKAEIEAETGYAYALFALWRLLHRNRDAAFQGRY